MSQVGEELHSNNIELFKEFKINYNFSYISKFQKIVLSCEINQYPLAK